MTAAWRDSLVALVIAALAVGAYGTAFLLLAPDLPETTIYSVEPE